MGELQPNLAIRLEVLGPFRLFVDGDEVEVSRPQVRTVLALLSSAPDGVSTDRLIEALWFDQAPSDPAAALRTIMSRTRSTLGEHADRLVSVADSHRLDVSSDLSELEQLLEDAKAADSQRKHELLEQARPLVRGDAFTGAIDSPEIATQRSRIERLIESVSRQLVRSYAEIGKDREAADLARELLSEAEEDEGLACDAAMSLARLGRKAESLELLQATRTKLIERGLEPSSALVAVETEILQGGTDLVTSPTEASPVDQSNTYVGREDELAVLCTMGPPSVAVVEGEAGIGKTSLLDAFERRLEADGVPVIRSTASLYASAPMQLIGELADKLLDLDGSDVGEQHRSALAMLVPDRIDGGTRPSSREALVSGAVDFIAERCAASGAVVLIDDAQWLDVASLAALADLIDEGRLRLVIATRPGTQKRVLGDVRADAVVYVGPLSDGECDALIRAELPDASAQQITNYEQRSGGNPFFLQMLIDLARQDIGAEESLPPAVLLAVQKRFELLSQHARRVLQRASVVGREFCPSLLDQLEPNSSVGLRESEEQGLIQRVAPDGDYAFRHAIVADAAYQLLGDGERASLHDQVGRILEQHGETPMVIWPHCVKASELDGWRAVDFATRTANQQLDAYDWEGALESAQWGLDYDEKMGGTGFGSTHALSIAKARAELAMGVPNSHLGLIDGAHHALAVGDKSALVGAVIELCNSGSVALTGVELRPVKELVDAALACASVDGRLRELQAAAARAFVYSRHGEFGQDLYAEAFANFDLVDRRVQELILRNSEAGLSNPRDFELAQQATLLLTEAADRNPELRWLARWFQYRDALILGDGDRLASTLQDLRSSATSSERRHAFVVLGQTFDMEMQRSWAEATMALIHDDFELAEACANQALEVGLKQLAIRNDGFGEGWVTSSYGLLLLAVRHGQGRLAELVDVVETTSPSIPAWRVAIVMANHAAGNLERVRDELDVLTANDFEVLVADPTWTAAMFLLGRPVAEFSDASTVEKLYERIEPYANRMSYSGLCTFGPMHEALAVLADALGRTEVARGHREKAEVMTGQLRQSSKWGYDEIPRP